MITNPKLVFHFQGNDLREGRSLIQTITRDYIIRGSISFNKCLLNNLKSSSNTVSLKIDKKCDSIEDIIKTNSDIKAYFMDEGVTLFTGFISTSFSWSVSDIGDSSLSITLEDTGTRLLERTFIESGYHFFDCSVWALVKSIADRCKLSISSTCKQIDTKISHTVDSSIVCKDILSQVLYEINCAYYFNNNGELEIYEIECEGKEYDKIETKDLYVVSGKAISVSKKIRQYKSARITYTTLASTKGYLIYRNTSGADNTHPYCNLQLAKDEYFDGVEIYSKEEWEESEKTITERVQNNIEAVNASSETTIIASNKIIAISNISQIMETDSSTYLTSFSSIVGGAFFNITAHNSDNKTHFITRYDVYADVVYEKATNIIKTLQIL